MDVKKNVQAKKSHVQVKPPPNYTVVFYKINLFFSVFPFINTNLGSKNFYKRFFSSKISENIKKIGDLLLF